MELKKETIAGGFVCIRVKGHVDALTAPALEKEVVAAFSAPQSRCLVDLAGVEYMSSAGLRVLVVGAKTAESVKGVFAVCSIQDAVRKVLATVGFFSRIAVYDSESAAVAAIGSPANP